MRQLWKLHNFGVTDTLPGRVRLGWRGDFTIFAPKKHFSIGFADGAAIHGFGKKDFDKAFYIYGLEEVIERSCVETGKYFHLSSPPDDEPSQNFDEYQEVDEQWLEERNKDPFVTKASEGINITEKTDSTLSTFIEEVCFYQYLDDIFDYANLAKKHGTDTAWNYFLPCLHERFIFNAVQRPKPKAQTLQSFIEQQLEKPQTLLFLHFKDEQDVLCQAQSEFINLMSFYTKEEYENLNIVIADVIIRDVLGNKPYHDEWHEYFVDNMLGQAGTILQSDPAPFVMVLGKPRKEALESQTAFVRKKGNHLVDFDLFQGCRELLAEEKSCNFEARDIYKENLKQAIHEILRCGGLVTDNATVRGKDYRGWPEDKVDWAMLELEENSVVIKVHTKKNGIVGMALKLCSHLKLSGCPYVSMVLADGPEDEIEVHDDTDIYSVFNITEETESLFWGLEQAARRKYMSHKLNGASPLMLKPEKSVSSAPQEKAPEVFSSLKKPLH